jgi:hypothetical protein
MTGTAATAGHIRRWGFAHARPADGEPPPPCRSALFRLESVGDGSPAGGDAMHALALTLVGDDDDADGLASHHHPAWVSRFTVGDLTEDQVGLDRGVVFGFWTRRDGAFAFPNPAQN